jgi:membrane protease YdiL (CAAX protease family)
VAFALAASFAEEPGWRGYALDRLGRRPWRAAVVISSVWAIWHLPLYAISGTFQHDDVGFATALFWIIRASFLPQTILMV